MIDVDAAEDLVRYLRDAAMAAMYQTQITERITDDELLELKDRLGPAIADALRPLVEGQQ
jgi:hypothetical protein